MSKHRTATRMTVGTKMMAGVGASCIVALMLSVFCIQTIAGFRKRFDKTVDDTVAAMQLASKLRLGAINLISAQRGLILGAVSKSAAEMTSNEKVFRE